MNGDDEEQFRADDEEAEAEADYSGPFCRHYGDPDDCDEACAECGHQCQYHHNECTVLGCSCEAWVWEEDAGP